MEHIEPTVAADDTVSTRDQVSPRPEHVKWLLWHGNVGRTLAEMENIIFVAEAASNGKDGVHKLLRAAKEFATHIKGNAGLIPNYGERWKPSARR